MDYRICTKTVFDTISDPFITFDKDGVCNYYYEYFDIMENRIPPPELKKKKLDEIIQKIKDEGKGKEYDCVIGVSGGVDSTYTAYYVKQLGLRPLAVHMDNGWNSETAVVNIKKTLKTLDIDLYTEVLDWEEFKDLQLSFLRSSVPDGEIPTDHAIYGVLFKTAAKFGIKYIVSGTNTVTEALMPYQWSYGHLDWKYISTLHKTFGTKKLKTYPHISLPKLFYYTVIKKIKSVSILDLMDYNKNSATELLEKELNWKNYGGKHYESIYTRFFQGHWLPKKFNIDKRKGHLSTLICSGQITRDEALEELKRSPYPDEDLEREDKNFVANKFGISMQEMDKIFNDKVKFYYDYPNSDKLLKKLRKVFENLRKRRLSKS